MCVHFLVILRAHYYVAVVLISVRCNNILFVYLFVPFLCFYMFVSLFASLFLYVRFFVSICLLLCFYMFVSLFLYVCLFVWFCFKDGAFSSVILLIRNPYEASVSEWNRRVTKSHVGHAGMEFFGKKK